MSKLNDAKFRLVVRKGVEAGLTTATNYNGVEGEPLYITDTKQLRLHDGTSYKVPVVTQLTAPSSASDTGTKGQIAFDGSYIYICSATNTWLRAAVATW